MNNLIVSIMNILITYDNFLLKLTENIRKISFYDLTTHVIPCYPINVISIYCLFYILVFKFYL